MKDRYKRREAATWRAMLKAMNSIEDLYEAFCKSMPNDMARETTATFLETTAQGWRKEDGN